MNFRNARRLWVVGLFSIWLGIILLTSSPKNLVLNLSNDYVEKGFVNFPYSAAYREEETIYSKQLINDSTFDLSPGTSPWNSTLCGDTGDLNAKLESNQCNSTIVGDTRIIPIVANFSKPGEWTAMHNPEFPSYPVYPAGGTDSYGNDSFGLWANHTWNKDERQTPSINWVSNISLSLNISDYEITSVVVNGIINGSVDTNLEVNSGEASAPTRFSVGDYARFYVRIADLERTNVYELAYNRTAPDLGLDSHPNPDTQVNTNLTSVNEELLKFYLASALSHDFSNFTIILGIDFWCEDNRQNDVDTWNSMRIKSFNMNFTLEKKINYNSDIAWNETGYRINTTEYLGGGNEIDVDILNATLNFNYRLTQIWPTASPNSEIRVYINNYLHTETIKMSNGTTSVQSVKGGQGFDVASLVTLNQNVTIRIQIVILDNFLMSQNCSLLIDNVNLTVFFEATVRTTVPDTQLKLVGSSTIAPHWNETFMITANYTRVDTGAGIPGANITVGWIDSYNVTDLGDGRYNVTCNTTVTSANQQYTLQILAEAWGNESQSYSANVEIMERPTHLHIFLNGEDLTGDPVITTPWNQTVNITAFYHDTGTTENILDAQVEISGSDLNPVSYQFTDKGPANEFLVNSSYFEVGTHFISLSGSLGNYSFASKSITVKVTARPTALQLFLNQQDLTSDPEITIAWNQTVNITTFYYDTVFENDLLNALVELSGTDLHPSYYQYSPQGTGYEFLVNSSYYEVGTHFISLAVSLGNYSFASKSITVKVTTRPTFLSIFKNNQNVTQTSELDVPLTGTIELEVNFTDSVLNETIDNYDISLQGLTSQYYTLTLATTTHLKINTTGLELGIYLVSIIVGKSNYTQLSHSYQINVNEIPSLLTAEQESITIDPQAQFKIKCSFTIDATRMGIGGIIPGAEVSYFWSRGEGVLIDNGDGTFEIQLDGPLNPGAYKITITALKENYELQTIIIDLVVKSPDTGNLMTIIVALTTGLIGVAIAFLAYFAYFRYPPVVRKIRKVRGKLKKGRITKISSHPKKRIFIESMLREFGENFPPEGRNRFKSQYLQLEKEEPIDRQIPPDIDKPITSPRDLGAEKHIEDIKPVPVESQIPKKTYSKAFEQPKQVDFGTPPTVKSLPAVKPPSEAPSKKTTAERSLHETKASPEESVKKGNKESKKSTNEGEDSNKK